MTEHWYVYGASGHGKVVIDTLYRRGITVTLLIDDDPCAIGLSVLGRTVDGARDVLLAQRARVDNGIVAIGDNKTRRTVACWLTKECLPFGVVIDPSAVVSASAMIGAGTLVMAQAAINADVQVGEHAIINTGATVDHDCVVGDFVHLAPGVHLCGGVSVGAGALIGVGAVVVPGVHIGTEAIVGAGSTVIGDIPDGARVAGSPCRILEVRI